MKKILLLLSAIWLHGCQININTGSAYFTVTCDKCYIEYGIKDKNGSIKPAEKRLNWKSEVFKTSKKTIVEVTIVNESTGVIAGQIFINDKLIATESKTFTQKGGVLIVRGNTY